MKKKQNVISTSKDKLKVYIVEKKGNTYTYNLLIGGGYCSFGNSQKNLTNLVVIFFLSPYLVASRYRRVKLIVIMTGKTSQYYNQTVWTVWSRQSLSLVAIIALTPKKKKKIITDHMRMNLKNRWNSYDISGIWTSQYIQCSFWFGWIFRFGKNKAKPKKIHCHLRQSFVQAQLEDFHEHPRTEKTWWTTVPQCLSADLSTSYCP